MLSLSRSKNAGIIDRLTKLLLLDWEPLFYVLDPSEKIAVEHGLGRDSTYIEWSVNAQKKKKMTW
jgi:hypothetical protein